MSGLWGIHPAAAAAGAAAVGAGVTHAYHSSGASRPRRRSNQATFVVERGKDTSARAKRLVSSDAAGATAVSETAASGARAVATGAGTAATTATFPVASRAHVRGVLYDADGEPVVIDERARFGAEALFLSSLASSALAVAVTRALAARDARRDDSTRDVASEASRDLEGIARGIAAAAAAGDAGPSGPSGSGDVSGAPNRSPKASASFAVPRGLSPATPSDAIAGGARHEPSGAAPDAAPDTAPLTRELRALMEASPCQSPLDSDLDAEGDWMGSVVSSASPFATPARQALGALRDRQRAAAHAGAPFAEEAVREMERIVVRAARSAAASAKGSSACASGAATPLSRTRPALPRTANAHSFAATQEQRVVVSISALEKRDVAGVEAVAVEKTGKAPEKARPGEGVSGAPAPETPSPTAPTPKLPEGSGVFFTEKRGRASPSRAPSASHSSDAGSNRARSPPREPLAFVEKDNERQLRSASEATDAARDRVRVAEERYRAARERLKEASSVASRSRESSAMPTPRGGAENAEAGPCASHVESGRNRFGKTETVVTGTGTAKRADAAAEVREMAEKARAAAARSRLASARAATTAERAARDADAEASRVREAWTRRLARSPRATPGDDSLGQEVGSRDAVPADRWASSDEVRGKTDVLDRFMGSLTDMRASSPPDGEAAAGVGRDVGRDVDVDVDVDGPFASGGDEGGRREGDVSETSAPRAASGGARGGGGGAARDEAPAAQTEAAATPATRLGVLSVSLLGDPREGETLTLRVDAVALPPDCGPVTLRWQRGAHRAGPAGGSNPGTPRAGPPAPPAFKTILGARRASYTLTKADVGCVVRAVAAAGDANAGENVFGSAETRGAVAAREW